MSTRMNSNRGAEPPAGTNEGNLARPNPPVRIVGKCPILKELTEKEVLDWKSQWEEFKRLNQIGRAHV